jgi:type II secretory pathway pseudopilin PulG
MEPDMTPARFHRLVVATVIFSIATCVGVAMWLDAQDAADLIEPESHVTAELLHQLRTARAEAAQRRAKADSSHVRVEYHTQLLVIDTTSPAAAVNVLPDDTTRMSLVSRKGEARRYPVPLFFVHAYEDTRQAYQDERALRQYDESVVMPMLQQLVDSTSRDRKDALELALHWKRKANPRCGTKCKLLLGAGAGEALREMVGHWTRG